MIGGDFFTMKAKKTYAKPGDKKVKILMKALLAPKR